MTRGDIQAALHRFILEQFPAARTRGLEMQDSLLEKGIIDSLGVLEIVSFIEQHFTVTLTDDEMVADHFDSIPTLADMIEKKRRPEKTCSS